MAVHLQIRDVPDKLHCVQPTVDEWLDEIGKLTPVSISTPAAEAVREAREAEDAALANAPARS